MSGLWRLRAVGLLPLLPAAALGYLALYRAFQAAFPPLIALLLLLVIGGWLAGIKGPLLGLPGGELFAQVLLAIGYFSTALSLPPQAGMLELFGAVLVFLVCGEAAATFGPLVSHQLQLERTVAKGRPLVPPTKLGDLSEVGRRWFARAGIISGTSLALSGISVYAGGLLVLPAASVLGLGVLLVALIGLLIALLVAGAALSGDEDVAVEERRST